MEIQRSQYITACNCACFQSSDEFTACCYENRSDVLENCLTLMVWQTSCPIGFDVILKVVVMIFNLYFLFTWLMIVMESGSCVAGLVD